MKLPLLSFAYGLLWLGACHAGKGPTERRGDPVRRSRLGRSTIFSPRLSVVSVFQ